MKGTWIIVLLAAMLACGGPPEKAAEISGVIENLTDNELKVFYYKDLMVFAEEAVTVQAGRDGRFRASLPLSEGQLVYVSNAQISIGLYVHPGSKIHIEMDALNSAARPVISGEGSHESTFLIDYFFDIEADLGYRQLINSMVTLEPAAFVQFADSVSGKKLDYLMTHPTYKKLDKDFTEIIKTDILYDTYRLKLEYPTYYEIYFQGVHKPEIPDNYHDFADEAVSLTEGGLPGNFRSSGYVNFLSAYMNYRMEDYLEDVFDEHSFFDRYFMVAGKYLSGSNRDYIMAQGMIHILNTFDFESASARYQDYLQSTGTGAFRSLVADEFRLIQTLAPGNPAPDFTGRDINGEMVSLSDYRGQVVYLDFWASWCGPCVRELPHAKELKRKMANQRDLVFMYVSIDTDEESWRNTVRLHGIEGVHMNFPGTGTGAPARFNIKAVPSFFIIGRDGRIFDNKAPRPSDPLIYATLMTALLQ